MNYLIYGTSYRLIDLEIEKIVKDKKYNIYSLSDVSIDDILDDISYSSLFTEEKILVIKEANLLFDIKGDNTNYLEKLNKYLDSKDENIQIIFICKSKVNEKNKIVKEIVGKLSIINTPVVTKPYEVANLFNDILLKEGYKINKKDLDDFVNKCASNIDIVLQEFDKLKLIKNGNKIISERDVEEFISNYNVSDIFALKDALVNKNIESALKMLDEFETSKMDPVGIVIMLESEYETLYNIKALSERKLSNEDISKKLDNMHIYRVKILRETSRKYTLDELKKLILYLCDLNIKMVREDNLGFDEIRKFIVLL